MKRLSILICIVFASALGGQASGFDYRMDPSSPHDSQFRFAFAAKSPLASRPGSLDTLQAGVSPDYASAMTWYRVALTHGYQPPLLAKSWVYSELPEPLQFAWAAPNGDLIARTGKGSFMLSFEDSDRNWFRELNCRMTQWPDGEAQAVIDCNDGSQRTMLIPEEGGVVIDDRQYSRAFRQEPVDFEDPLPADYEPIDLEMSIE